MFWVDDVNFRNADTQLVNFTCGTPPKTELIVSSQNFCRLLALKTMFCRYIHTECTKCSVLDSNPNLVYHL